jgi:hypothetical protein
MVGWRYEVYSGVGAPEYDIEHKGSNLIVVIFQPVNIQGIVAELHQERKRITQAIAALESLNGSTRTTGQTRKTAKGSASTGQGGRKLSALALANIRRAQKARRAREQSSTTQIKPAIPKRTMSASARRKIAAAQRARWAKVKKPA